MGSISSYRKHLDQRIYVRFQVLLLCKKVLKLFSIHAEISYNSENITKESEHMNINGVYGTKIPQATSDKGISSNTKSSQTIAKSNNVGTLPIVPDNEFLTYDEKVNVVPEASATEEKQSDEDSLKNSSESMTEEDYKALSEEGISLEEYNVERLERALERIKDQRIMNQETLDNMKLKIEEKVQSLMNIRNLNGLTKKIVNKLMEAQMPVTESNILKLANAMEMAQAVTQISDQSMVYIIKNNQMLTIENIYKAQYSGIYSQSKDITEETWNQLQSKVYEIITNAGLNLNSDNIDSAKWLLQNNLPVTEENIATMYDLNKMKNGINEEQLLVNMVATLSKGKGPEATSISTYIEDQVIRSIEAFQSISDEAVNYAIENQPVGNVDQINLKALQQAQGEVNRIKAEGNNEFISMELNSEIDIKSVTVRRQLEEIRLKLTVEASGELLKKGIRIETDNLSKLIEGLKEFEDRYYQNLLEEGEVNVNTTNIELLKDCITGIEELKTTPNYILGSTLSSRKIETVNGLITEGKTIKQNLERANESYETLMTKPRKDMGDSISKAFQNVDAILEDLNLDLTKANQRAVRILGYNNIDITNENINHVKAYDEQVNYMMKNLHPAVATHLIKTGLNPLNMHVEEVNKCIDQVKGELGISGEEKYSKFLYKLEKENGITNDEKKAFIGIYRLLNNVEKTGGAALGSVLKADKDVTMNNLLTAVRTIKSGGVQVSVDDSFGSLEGLTYTRENISEQIETAFHSMDNTRSTNTFQSEMAGKEVEYEYYEVLLKGIIEEITPQKLQSMGTLDELMNMPMDKLFEVLENHVDNSNTENIYWSSKLQELKESIGNADNALKLLKDYQIPTNIKNTQCANDILNGDHSYYNQWKKQLEQVNDTMIKEEPTFEDSSLQNMSQNLLNSLTNKSSMMEQYDRVEQDINKVLNKLYENPTITAQEISNLQRISNGFSFLQKLAHRESYELPMLIGDKITNVNITFIRNTGESGKIDLNIKSETLGNIKVDMQVKENGIKGLITCENRKTLDLLVSDRESLENNISNSSGVPVKNLSYGIINSRPELYQSKNISIDGNNNDAVIVEDKTKTNVLYSIGKIVLTNIKTLEETYENTYAR